MLLMQAISIAFLAVLVDSLSGCVNTSAVKDAPVMGPHLPKESPKPEFHQQVETSISLSTSFGDAEVNADIFRPQKMIEPKTLIILVPGSGNVSRKGETTTDGVRIFERAVLTHQSWGMALADKGFFVMSYDKRTCTSRINPICHTNVQKDIDEKGIAMLAQDLDQAYQFARRKLNAKQNDGARIVLMSSTQGAQTIALAECAKEASGIILFSPIIGDLESMWIKGLGNAANKSGPSQKMRLLNQKESMAAFFKSLKGGAFPEESIIRGASAKFWRSWIDTSQITLNLIKRNQRPSLLLFRLSDTFGGEMMPTIKKNLVPGGRIIVKTISSSDRNFVNDGSVPKEALDEVLRFIKGLSNPSLATR
jgi:hypothetical protein